MYDVCTGVFAKGRVVPEDVVTLSVFTQRMTSKRDTETTPHHSATPNTETPPNSASIYIYICNYSFP